MNHTEKITAQPVTIADRQIVPILDRTAWLTHHGGWYTARVCSIRIEENGKVYEYPLIPSLPDQNTEGEDISGKTDSKIP